MAHGISQLESRDWTFKKDVTVTGDLTVSGSFSFGDSSADSLTVTGTLTVGVDDTGYDVQFFGATSGAHMLWDESADTLKLVGGAATNLQGTLTVGVDDTGYDVKFFGATASKFAVWDESADDFILADGVALQLGGDESTADGFKVEFDGTDTLDINALTAGDKVAIGDTTTTGFTHAAESVTPNNDSGAASTITAGVTAVDVQAVTNDANDWIVLPSLASVPVGHTIRIACNAGGNFEMRTPASSNEKINTVDSDGTQEYLCTDTEVITITKVSATDGWVATAQTALGAIATAVVPD